MRLQPDRSRQPVARPATYAPVILLALLLATSAARAADDIATFDDGAPALTSYPGQDSQPAAWSLVTGWGGAGSALQLSGDTWKVLAIAPRAVADTTVWRVAVNAAVKGGTQAIGFGDGVRELFYTVAGRDLPTATNWFTVYQGAFATGAWEPYLLPVGRDWRAAFGAGDPVIDRVFFVNESGAGSAGTTRFDAIADVTDDQPRAPRVNIQYTIEQQRKLRAGAWDVTARFGAAVHDPDSDAFTWLWDFGDGQGSPLPDPVHTFTVTASHPWTVGLVVRDETGLAGGDTCRVVVHEGPGDGTLTVNFVGDVFTGRGYETGGGIIATDGIEALFAPTLPIFGQAADVNVANLEVSYTSRGTPHPTKSVVFRSRPENIAGLPFAGIDLVTLGNNHIIDYGEVGMLDTMAGLDALGIPYCGAGSSEVMALQPAFRSQGGVRLGFLGLCNRTGREWNYQPFLDAGWDKPGFAHLLPAQLGAAIDATRPQADVVIVQTHSGAEYQLVPPLAAAPGGFDVEDTGKEAPEFRFLNEPTPSERELRRLALDLGADVLINHHPHVLQGFEAWNGKLIAHSLGNFVFDLSYVETMPTGVLTLEVDATGITGYRFTPAFIDHWIPRPAVGNLGREILGWLADQSRAMNVVMVPDPAAVPGPQARLHLSRAGLDSTVVPLDLAFTPVEKDGYVTSPPLPLPADGFLTAVFGVTGGGAGGGWEVAWGRELLWHTGFEDEGADFWDVNTADETLDPAVSHGGARSLAVKRDAAQSGQTGTDLIAHLMCRADRRHTAAGWLRTENAAAARIMARFYGTRTTETPLSDTELGARVNGTTGWTWQWRDLETPTAAAWFELRCAVEPPATGAGTAWFDDLAFIEWDPWQPLDGTLKVPAPHNLRYLQVRRAGTGAAAGVVTAGLTAYGEAASAVPSGRDGVPLAAAPARLACHPNPFNPRTTVEVELAAAGTDAAPPVRVTIHDLAGRRLRTLHDGPLAGGRRHGLSWDGADDRGRPLASGTYLCRATVAGIAAPALKLVLVR
ncbi:MAG: CapA family protein [bacterium]|nr:CapA family protein [bacterium]